MGVFVSSHSFRRASRPVASGRGGSGGWWSLFSVISVVWPRRLVVGAVVYGDGRGNARSSGQWREVLLSKTGGWEDGKRLLGHRDLPVNVI